MLKCGTFIKYKLPCNSFMLLVLLILCTHLLYILYKRLDGLLPVAPAKKGISTFNYWILQCANRTSQSKTI